MADTLDTVGEILDELRSLGSDSYKKVMLKHGVREPLYGVKIEHLKRIQNRVKTDYRLALDLFETGVYDAMYLAGLVADDAKMTRKDLRRWLSVANSKPLFAYTIPWVAAGSEQGWALALEWIDSKKPHVAVAGWSTLAGIVSFRDDAELDLKSLKQLLQRVANTVHDQPDDVRYVMNGFVIAVGCYVKPLTGDAVAAARKMGRVTVDMGDTACQVPDASAYIAKAEARGTLGRKRKTVKC